MKTYKFYNDPGHAWMAVKRNELNQLGIADKISSYSYQKGQTVYLEEDMDAPTFLNALKNKNIPCLIKDIIVNGYSPIRYYEYYRPDVIIKPSDFDHIFRK